MKKMLLFILLLIIFISSDCFADTLYLNSGRIVKGTILEETDAHIKMDVVGVPVTFFRSEIERIEKKDTFQIKKGSASERYLMYLETLNSASDITDIEDFVISEKFLEMQKVATDINYARLLGAIPFLTPSSEEINSLQEESDGQVAVLNILARGRTVEGTVKMVKEDGLWKIKEEIWQEHASGIVSSHKVPEPEISMQEQNFGSISGKVYLPQTKQKGNLYIYFMPSRQIQSPAGSVARNSGVVIKASDVITNEVPYELKDVPTGGYFGFVTWDLAEPFCIGETFLCSGFTGDYIGNLLEEISVAEGQNIENVNFTRLDFQKPINPEDYSDNYKISGVQYKIDAFGQGKFMLAIKNLGRKPVRTISLNCTINGRETPGFLAPGLGSLIGVGETTEFNITNCFQDYFAKLERYKEKQVASKLLKVVISSNDNHRVFKTTIDAKNLSYRVKTRTYGGGELYEVTFH